MRAFSEYSRASSLEAQQLNAARPAGNPLLALTRGLGRPPAAASAGAGAAHAPDTAHLTLPDGRLHVGTHLPLLAGRYKYLSTLGEGVSAQVILADDTLAPGGRLVAIKVMRRQHAPAGQREARALGFLHASAPGGAAPGLVRLLDTFQLGAHFCLVTERLFPRLLDWIADSSQLPAEAALAALRKIAHQLLVAVAHMHAQGVVNADLKPHNILMCTPPGGSSVALKMVDLGNSFSLTETDHSAVAIEVQTLPYRAPEAALGLPHGAPIDLWSLGVVLAEMALKRALLPCATPLDLLRLMAALLGPLPGAMVASSALAQQLGPSALQHLCSTPSSAEAADGRGAGQLAGPGRALGAGKAAGRAAAGGGNGVADLLPAAGAARKPQGSCQLYAELAAVDASLADLIMRLLAYEPAKRITAQQALLHPFFDPLCALRAAFPQLQPLLPAQPATPQEAARHRRPEPAAQLEARLQPPAVAGRARGAAAAAAAPAGAPARAPGRAISPDTEALMQLHRSAAAAAVAEEAEAQAAEQLAARKVEPWSSAERAARQQQQQEQAQQQQQPALHPAGRQQQQQRGREPQASVQVSSSRPEQRQQQQPWQALSAALAWPSRQPSSLPAAQLAARQWEEQRRQAAADPYAGSFGFEATPPGKLALQGGGKGQEEGEEDGLAGGQAGGRRAADLTPQSGRRQPRAPAAAAAEEEEEEEEAEQKLSPATVRALQAVAEEEEEEDDAGEGAAAAPEAPQAGGRAAAGRAAAAAAQKSGGQKQGRQTRGGGGRSKEEAGGKAGGKAGSSRKPRAGGTAAAADPELAAEEAAQEPVTSALALLSDAAAEQDAKEQRRRDRQAAAAARAAAGGALREPAGAPKSGGKRKQGPDGAGGQTPHAKAKGAPKTGGKSAAKAGGKQAAAQTPAGKKRREEQPPAAPPAASPRQLQPPPVPPAAQSAAVTAQSGEGPPATAVKRARREKQAGDKPWWVA